MLLSELLCLNELKWGFLCLADSNISQSADCQSLENPAVFPVFGANWFMFWNTRNNARLLSEILHFFWQHCALRREKLKLKPDYIIILNKVKPLTFPFFCQHFGNLSDFSSFSSPKIWLVLFFYIPLHSLSENIRGHWRSVLWKDLHRQRSSTRSDSLVFPPWLRISWELGIWNEPFNFIWTFQYRFTFYFDDG